MFTPALEVVDGKVSIPDEGYGWGVNSGRLVTIGRISGVDIIKTASNLTGLNDLSGLGPF